MWPASDYQPCLYLGAHIRSQRHNRAACYIPLDNDSNKEYDQSMTTVEVRRAELELAAAERNLRFAQLQLARAERDAAAAALPPEPARGTMLKFNVQFREGEKTYPYVAIRTDEGPWMITGTRYAGKKLTWEKIVEIADRNWKGRPHFQDIT